MSIHQLPQPNLLQDARVYLSGPMDFVASREVERKYGWRTRVGQFLSRLGITVFDPWNKPELYGILNYGREDETTTRTREQWTFRPGVEGAKARSACAQSFWPALHIDLRLVDTSDFVVAYCPTNVYSVGTVHEIILARQQRKPVLFVSPSITFPALDDMLQHLKDKGDARGLALLERMRNEIPIKVNDKGAPSLWYMPLVGTESFFDGFGFEQYMGTFSWERGPLDDKEQRHTPQRPLLPFLEKLNDALPDKWDWRREKHVPDDDWLLWKVESENGGGRLDDVYAVTAPSPQS